MSVDYVTAAGLRFAYLSQGAGPLALLFHGFPDTPHTWDAVAPRIAAKGYRVVMPFMRGYRPTQIPAHDTDAMTLARDPIALIDALGEKQATLIGHDWGAAAVYGAVALAPERVRKVFALSIPHPATLRATPAKVWRVRHFLEFKLPTAARRFAKNDFEALRAICKRWSPDWNPGDAEFAAVRECFADPASLNAAFGYYRALSFGWPKALRNKTSVPAVVFYGSGDPITEPSDYERGRAMFTGDYTIEATGGGHFLHREDPEGFARKLLAHL